MEGSTVRQTVVVVNPEGLHLRPADLIVKTVGRYSAQVELIKDSTRVDARSILSLLALAATQGTELAVEATGPEAHEAVEALSNLIRHGFHEASSNGQAEPAAPPEQRTDEG